MERPDHNEKYQRWNARKLDKTNSVVKVNSSAFQSHDIELQTLQVEQSDFENIYLNINQHHHTNQVLRHDSKGRRSSSKLGKSM